MADTGAQTRRPADTPFKQQRLRAWQPVFTPHWVVACFVFTATVFLPIGALVIVASDQVMEHELRYDPLFKDCHWSRGSNPSFDNVCLKSGADRNQDADKCGMLAKLGLGCPRDWSAGAVALDPQSAARLGERDASGRRRCDPHCSNMIEFTIEETMEAPVYLYYKLTNFYQNHRRYAKSRSDAQLAGEDASGSLVEDCAPLRNPGKLGNGTWCNLNFDNGGGGCGSVKVGRCANVQAGGTCANSDFTSTRTAGDFLYSSCGLVAWSQFNDSFRIRKCADDSCSTFESVCDGEAFNRTTGESLVAQDCQKQEIAWAADRDKKFQEPYSSETILTYRGKKELLNCSTEASCDFWVKDPAVMPYFLNGWYLFDPYHEIPSPIDEDFMVWMRTASLPTFRKLYRKINRNLEPGKYQVEVSHRFDTSGFDGEKYVILSTLSWIGGKNYFLGGAYIAVGSLCFLLAIGFAVKHFFFRTNTATTLQTYNETAR
eukprot:TRINITY_DN19396_c0_g1_i1.p1 TRINITY_DN19396_c0_g1~~TRINITY_DN19396_c0_g1_i1.p1  ORF type:complete len:529 (+),score=102.12 TRINITY_DN19396_c0_g1_i1:127-1587(+)